MKIKVMSDSTCDLSKDLISKYNVEILPLTVIKGGIAYKDGVDITPADIFSHVAAGNDLCSTTATNVGEYTEVFAKYSQEYDGIIHISLGSGFSSSYQNACIAADDFPNVRVIDSQNLSTGQGLVVLKACELAAQCDDLDAIAKALTEYTTRIEASFILDQLGYMVKGGRCSAVAALGANLLSLKPCIEVKNGKMSVVKKYRGNFSKCITAYIKDRLADREDIDCGTLFVTHTPVSKDCMTSVQECIDAYSKFDTVYRTEAGCTVSCHCGPSTLGVLFVRSK